MATTIQQRFARFIRPHLDPLRRAAYRLCRSAPDAEDLVQEVCLRAFERIRELDDIESPRAWLLRVQFNLHIDSTRRREKAATESLDEPHHPESQYSTDAAGPEADAEAALLAETLTAAWDQLNKDQQALLAFSAEGYSLNEIVDITGLPLSALKARLHRARVRLGKLLRTPGQQPRVVAISGESV